MIELEALGILFDLDGVLVDSGAAVERHWRAFAARIDIAPETMLRAAHGRRSFDVIADLVAPERHLEEARWFEDLEVDDVEGVAALPGATELLAALPPHRWAIVTSCGARLATARLIAAGLEAPANLISADDVTAGKPDPDGYRQGMRALAVDPGRTIVFEDAPAGILAGRAAGATVIGVATSHSQSELGGDHVVRDLASVTVAEQPGSVVLRLTD